MDMINEEKRSNPGGNISTVKIIARNANQPITALDGVPQVGLMLSLKGRMEDIKYVKCLVCGGNPRRYLSHTEA